MGLGAVGGAGPSDGSGGFGGGGADGIHGGSDSGGGPEHDGGRADSCGSCSEGGFGGLGIGNPGSYGGEQSMDGDTEEEDNNSSNSKNQEDDSVNVTQDKLFDSYNQAPSSSMAFNGIEDFARSLSATGGPPPGATSSDIPETDPAEANEEEEEKQTAQPDKSTVDIITEALSHAGKSIGSYLNERGKEVCEYMQSDYVQGQFHQFEWAATASPIDLATEIGKTVGLNGKSGNELVGGVINFSASPICDVVQNIIKR